MPRIEEAVGRSAPFVKVQPPVIQAQRAPVSTDTDYPLGQGWLDESVSPSILYWHLGGGDWNTNELTLSTDGTFTAPLDTTASSSLAIKTYVDATATAGAPVATESTAGIGELATDVEAVAGTASTGVLALLVTPSNLTPVFAAAPAIGGTTPAAATFTDLTTSGTVNIIGDAAMLIDVAGAGIDLTLSSDAGRVIIQGDEAAANAVTIASTSGGLDVDVALQMNLASSQNAATAIVMTASAGGIDITAVGAAAEDLDLACTNGSVNITAGESANDAITIVAAAGGIDILCTGTAGEDIDIAATGSSVNISSSENIATAITIDASAGGIDITNTGTAGEDIDIASSGASVNVTSTENAALAIHLHANGGTSETIRLRSDQGTGTNSIEMISDVGGILSQSGLNNANAIYLHANAGTSETIKIHSDQGTGVASIEVASDVGGVTLSSGLASADAININASDAAGGIDVDCGTAGFIVDAASGPISLDGAVSSNFNVTGAGIDIDIGSSAGRIIVTAGEDAADAIYLRANAGTSEKIRLHADQGTGLDSVELESDVGGVTVTAGVANAAAFDVNLASGGMTVDAGLGISLDAAAASNFSTSGAGIDLTLASASGRVIVDAGEDAADAIYLHANAGTSEKIRLHSDQGTSVDSVELESDVGGITLLSGLASADAINLTSSAGGVDVDGALEVNIASSQAASSAITLSASNAAGGITHTGKCIYTPDAITSDNAGVAASVSTVVTEITTDGDSNLDNVTLANGVDGQVKIFAVVASGNAADSIKITPANMIGGTQITFSADPVGLGCMMIFDSGVSGWCVVGNNGGTVA